MWFYSRQCVRNNQNQIIQKRKSFDFLFIYPLFPPINFPFKNNRLSTANIKGILLCKYAYSLVYQAFSIKMSTSLPNRQLRNSANICGHRDLTSLPNRQLRKMYKNIFNSFIASLPNRQLRKIRILELRVIMASLPNRQLRNFPASPLAKRPSSLPNRQLRKRKLLVKMQIITSLPNRQLRNIFPPCYAKWATSLPNRQLRKIPVY